MIACKFLGELAGRGVDSDAVRGSHGVEYFRGGRSYVEGVFPGKMEIVKKERNKTLRQSSCYGAFFDGACVGMIGDSQDGNGMRGRGFQAERGDGLWLTIIEEREVLFFEIIDDFAVLVADYDAQQDQVYAYFERSGGVASDYFCCGW